VQESSKIPSQFQLIGTIFAALLGLAFGSFLNVFLSRFPEGESIVTPRSHCRHCEHTLAWWENIPLLSWILLRGRCRSCRAWIGVRYPLVELAVGLLWAGCWIRFSQPLFSPSESVNSEIPRLLAHTLIQVIGYALLCWLLVALAVLDAEFFWLPDWLTLPGIGLGFLFTLLETWSHWLFDQPVRIAHAAWSSVLAILAAAGLILLIRLGYWLVRRQEGMGLGDAKLMAMLAAWLGLFGAFKCFAIAMLAASVVAFLWLAVLAIRRDTGDWAKMPMPLGTFLSLAGLLQVFCSDWLFNPGQFGF
jgi:leader peptidase (prepilin peptidase)/N-methyltransferase